MADLFDFVVLTVFVIMLPLLADLLNGMFPHANTGRLAQSVVGYVLVFFIASLILVGFYLWYTVYFPYLVITHHLEISSPIYHINVILCVFLVFTILFYYYMSITTTSYMKRHPRPRVTPTTTTTTTTTTTNTTNNYNNFCQYCNASKLPATNRSYHCRICTRCTCRMDHHCPFIANCVGIRNHHYFISFLIYAIMGISYACYLSYLPFRDCVLNTPAVDDLCLQLGKHNYIFMCAVLVLIPLVAILSWQLYVVISDTMTVEILKHFRTIPFKSWIPWLYTNFRNKVNRDNLSRLYGNRWKLYNIIVPFI